MKPLTRLRPFFGFTLMELLITMSIIAILIAIGIASYSTINKQSRDTRRKSDIEQIRSALEMYRTDNGSYPAVNINGFDFANYLFDELVSQNYLSSIPTDPIPASYTYYYKAANHDQTTDKYYGYCLCAHLEVNQTTDSDCEDTLPQSQCTYGRRNP